MNIYILNRLGKTIYVHALSTPSKEPGVLYDVKLELHTKRPKRVKDTISVLRIENDDSEWLSDQHSGARIHISSKLGWKFDLKSHKEDGDIIIELIARNGKSF